MSNEVFCVDTMVKPILLYDCDILGLGNNDMLKRVHLKFCKIILNIKASSPNYMIYGELCRYQVEIDIRMGNIRRRYGEANVSQDLIGHENRWRYITQTKRTPRSRKRQQSPSAIRPYSPKTPRNRRKEVQNWATFKTEVETTMGQL